MSNALPQPAGELESRPGKIRTWWHPLLANMLRWQLGSHYEVQEEVPVGKKPLQIGVGRVEPSAADSVQPQLPAGCRRDLRRFAAGRLY